ncbi:ScyD/ScyE family protein [Amycolatopsis alkalitolerans]|uniref:ScyD/ScyE family protein n=1 Tax=Amycolatopsis alkalitolerans TaxID=2547244 RepID=A0A5C4M5D0_9PSEU|nr:ScyD/ScyE family protein [Amycolatopsis alkalitolerans]TNC28444.1 ScyD/ScyE family protein [Amycolatopsis alkalitolerans]
MRTTRLLVTAVTAFAAVLVPVAAEAGGAGQVKIASGLNSPRGLAFAPDGGLYVAEAGTGGAGPCAPGPEGGLVCFGTSGSIMRITDQGQKRVVTGLPSLAAPDGSNAVGPSDVSFQGTGNMYATLGLGGNPTTVRPQLPPAGQQLGWLLRNGKPVTDISGYEVKANPDGGEVDTNPNSVAALPGGEAVADAGGNDLLWVAANGKISTIATFPDRLVDAPPFLGLPPGTKIPMQSVPTSVVRGPDGAFYVGELTGFPFPKGAARVYRVVPGHAPQIYAEGFTNIIDIGFDHGKLYVLEIAHNGLLGADTDPSGALLRVDRHGSPEIVSQSLTLPGGLALKDGKAYVSDCGACPGPAGSVVRIRL